MTQFDSDETSDGGQQPGNGMPGTVEEAYRHARILYLAMMAGLTAMSIVMFGIHNSTGGSMTLQGIAGMVLAGTCVLMLVTMVTTGFVIHKKHLQDNTDPETGEPTPAAVQAATILRLAMIEGPSLFGSICILLVHPAMVAIPALGLCLMILTYPRRKTSDDFGRNPYDPRQGD